MMEMFHTVSQFCSEITTKQYSTSFSSAISLLHKDLRQPVYNIYGFVRFADEIVDTFHEYDKPVLLAQFKQETFDAIERRISLNPILNSFQKTVNEYGIDQQLIRAFFQSMEMDLVEKKYNTRDFGEYVYGSAETVGLMCLYIFCAGRKDLYEELQAPARSLGAAFQKVNFLRDFKSDYKSLSRMYFPNCNFDGFTTDNKTQIEIDIEADFSNAYKGILRLPMKARFGVYVAYKYYMSLFKKIKRMKPAVVLESRVRIPNYYKAIIVLRAGLKNQMGLIKDA